MEQNIQQQEQVSVEQAKLPTKTKIAAWLLIIVGGITNMLAIIPIVILVALSASGNGLLTGGWDVGTFFLLLILVMIFCGTLCGLIFLLSGWFILKRKRWAFSLLKISILFLVLIVLITCFLLPFLF